MLQHFLVEILVIQLCRNVNHTLLRSTNRPHTSVFHLSKLTSIQLNCLETRDLAKEDIEDSASTTDSYNATNKLILVTSIS